MTPNAFRIFLTDLLKEESIVTFTPPAVSQSADRSTIVAWPNRRSLTTQKQITEYSLEEYLADLTENNYTCLLPNAALIQIEYRWQGGNLRYHRYCYIPAPFELNGQSVQPDEIEQLIDLASGLNAGDVRLRTKLRFEFDESQVAIDHPRSHLHIHYPNCRIPVKSSIGVHSFFQFVYRYFCSNQFSSSRVLSRRRNDGGADYLSEDERRREHITWHA